MAETLSRVRQDLALLVDGILFSVILQPFTKILIVSVVCNNLF